MRPVQWDDLTPGGMRLEQIRYELGMERQHFADILHLHPSDYCRVLRDDRLTKPRLVNIFQALMEHGHYKCFDAVMRDLDCFDDAGFYCWPLHCPCPLPKTLQKNALIKKLQEIYGKIKDRFDLVD